MMEWLVFAGCVLSLFGVVGLGGLIVQSLMDFFFPEEPTPKWEQPEDKEPV